MLGILSVTVVAAHDLPGANMFNSSADPFVKLKYGEETQKTNYKQKNLDPVWNQSFQFEVTK